MIHEWRLFLFAVQFLTRIPTPRLKDPPGDWLARSGKYFPIVGAMVGVFSALVLLCAHTFWRSGPLPVLLALAASIGLTGALHEDGLSDTVDAFAGRTSEQRLTIMKDPRLGAYGALALAFDLAIKAAALTSLPVPLAAAGLVCAHAGGRTAAVWTMSFLPYAADHAASKIDAPQRGLRPWELALGLALALAPSTLLIPPDAGTASIAAAALASFFMATAGKARFGGHTGDVLGAVEQVYEIVFLLILSGLAVARLSAT
jgi:adenosylcobinamide-GDP ribazoletransferase